MMGGTDSIPDLSNGADEAKGTWIAVLIHPCHKEPLGDDQGEEPTNSTQIQQDLSRLETIIQAQLAEIKLLKESLLTGQQEFSRLTTQLEKLQPMIESIHVWQRNITEPQKIWKLDKLSDFAGNAPEAFSAASKDTLIGRLTEQLEEKDSQLTEQEERIDNQAQEIQQLKTEITEKDQQLKELNQAINKLLVRMADGNADILTDLQTNSAGNVESEISSLREQVSRMESVLSQWKGIGDIHEMPNNISSEA
ncbi:unnamed protein product [Rhizoctonia solani]|uniref:Uncharacterized protein n=1 Tax=Rhizoctonia solani TaxID=456999 RepID=A0A8H3H0T6_9AGAM|nr:unnamed protein product [Rhizoctonia solani]